MFVFPFPRNLIILVCFNNLASLSSSCEVFTSVIDRISPTGYRILRTVCSCCDKLLFVDFFLRHLSLLGGGQLHTRDATSNQHILYFRPGTICFIDFNCMLRLISVSSSSQTTSVILVDSSYDTHGRSVGRSKIVPWKQTPPFILFILVTKQCLISSMLIAFFFRRLPVLFFNQPLSHTIISLA